MSAEYSVEEVRAQRDRLRSGGYCAADLLHIQRMLTAYADTLRKPPRFGGCCCGEPCTLGVVHRTDGPCFVYEQPADSGRVVEVDYTPGELDRTAPARIWLQIDTDGDNDERSEQWPGDDAVTWCSDSIGGLEIQYVRADLPALAAQGQGDAKPFGYVSRDMTPFRSGTPQWQFTHHRVEPHGCIEAMPVYTAPPASPAGVPDGMVLVPRWIIGNTLRAIRDVDAQFRATGHPSWRFEQLANLLAPLAAAPSASEGDGGAK